VRTACHWLFDRRRKSLDRQHLGRSAVVRHPTSQRGLWSFSELITVQVLSALWQIDLFGTWCALQVLSAVTVTAAVYKT